MKQPIPVEERRMRFSVAARNTTRVAFCTLLLLLGSSRISHAGEEASVLHLDLESAVRMALTRNFEIQGELYVPKIASAQLKAQQGVFDPSLRFSYETSETRPRNGSSLADAFANRRTNDQWNSGIVGLLPWGMTYDFGVQANRSSEGVNGVNGIPGAYQSFSGGTFLQPLLRGMGTGANLAQIRIARSQRESSDWALKAKVIDVISRTALLYHDLYFSIQNLRLEERSQQLARRLLDDNARRAQIGVMSPLDVTSARAEVAARENRVILARRAVRDNENYVKQLVTDEIEGLLNMRLRIEPFIPPAYATPDILESVRRAFDLRPDYREALLALQRRNINVVFARNDALPRLDLTASLGVNGLGNDLVQSVSDAFQRNRGEWTAGVVFRLPFPNREGSGQRQDAELQVARLLIDLKRLEQDIVVHIDNAAGEIETSRQRIIANAEARVLAAERLSAEQEKLTAGASTTFVVLELQKDLLAAEVAEIQAQTDYAKAITGFDAEVGTTLERYGVQLGGATTAPPAR